MGQYISSPSSTINILKDNKVRLTKTLGQNYLIDTNIAKKIVKYSDIRSSEYILEIGSGIGSLTELILPECKKVVCVELDRKISEIFKGLFEDYIGNKIVFLQEDALKIDYEGFLSRYKIDKVVSNLPYKIAAPLVIKMLIASKKGSSFYLTIQKDIADRMTASLRDKNYNAFSIKMKALSAVDVLFKVSQNCFYPKPHVDSVFIKIVKDMSLLPPILCEKQELSRFFDFLDNCFRHRRKRLISCLKEHNISSIDNMDLESKILSCIGKNKDVRPEELDIKDFIYLYNKIISG